MRKTLFDLLCDDPVWSSHPITKEAQAELVGANKRYLRMRLNEARQCLIKEYRDLPVMRYDFEEKRLYLGARYFLQWKTREYPDLPESYENQQTNRGNVELMEVIPAAEVAHRRLIELLDEFFDAAESEQA